MHEFSLFFGGMIFGCLCTIGGIAFCLIAYIWDKRRRGEAEHGKRILKQSRELRDRDQRHSQQAHNMRNIDNDDLGEVIADDWRAMA